MTGLLKRIGDTEVIVLVVTTEQFGVDRYSQELARRLDVEELTVRRYLSLPEAYKLARLIAKQRSIVHLPNQHFARYTLFLNQPFIVTVHDLARLCIGFDPETISERILLKFDKRHIKKAAHIIAVSHHTKSDLIEQLKIPGDKITVIYNGVDQDVFKPRHTMPHFLGQVETQYVLYVGSERPRKNLGRLFEAFALLKRDFPGLKLVKVGVPGRSERFRSKTMKELKRLGLIGEVIFPGYASDLDLARYYSAAALLAFPSLYEGFGLPPLEAMACGCPVVTSNTSSLPEVVGDAGVMVDPYDTAALARAIKQVLTDSELRNNLVAKGRERARRFSWQKTAQLTGRVYEKIAAQQQRASE